MSPVYIAPPLRDASPDHVCTTLSLWRPAISADRLTVYFQGDGVPGNDIWQMQRNSVAETFADPVPAAAFNSTGNEEDPWVSADHRTALFISNRSGQFQLWQATR